MKIEKLGSDLNGSWTVAFQSSRFAEFVPGTLYPAFGIALLWYKPERRLSVSVWCHAGSWNVRLYGPRKLSWQR